MRREEKEEYRDVQFLKADERAGRQRKGEEKRLRVTERRGIERGRVR